MIRILAALIVGAILAIGASMTVVNIASPNPEPPNKPLYNYGTR